ncbi:hypothetical protein NCAS_0F02950 [Naumovozyma castellii]|uniref:Nuclear condensin complex subunit 3 C-terminal domain-containing protein n=1 Tax=Naumovozyma castellii TaxID=27288 RepID=G0VH07_NAUCA|nr:hypothetical protein NCAS_0F02950 [Naumovozyma castellii CBS 4309]CCC70779.1 hypothetical protein NCAS_0F02950 [Naumovozyma castellii CBS 4309]
MSNESDMDVDNEEVNSRICRSVAEVFQKAQSTYAGHRKHIAVLKKIQSKAVDQGYEEAFNYWFNKCVTKILPLKKNEVVGDRIIKLIAAFIASLDRENDLLIQAQDQQNEDEEVDSTFSRFINQFVRHILRAIECKDKNVRFRVTQLLVVIMDNIGEIDEELYTLLLWSLNKRIYDKEPMVRIQAVFCLTKFQEENENEGEEELSDATQTLLKCIQNDPSAEVRRAAMLNLISNKKTRPYILERARDVNAINRRLVYSRVLKGMGKVLFEEVEPKILDQLIMWGLDDRESHVRRECTKLISHHWLNLLDGDLIRLLENLDITSSTFTSKALNSMFQSRSDIITKLKFPADLWKEFTIETAFLFRCFYIYCVENNLIEIIEENFPETAILADYLQFYLEKRFFPKNADTMNEEDNATYEFILEQLLIMANKYDFGDEIGRRSILNTVRTMLNFTKLPDSLIAIGLEVLKSLSINERDFITMAIEIINDIRDDDIELQEQEEHQKKRDATKEGNDEEEENDSVESFHSAVEHLVNGVSNMSEQDIMNQLPPEKEARPETMIQCLTRSAYMLKLVNTSLNENIMITSLIDTLITPAVRNTENKIRELGIRNMGLCCLLDLQLAIDNLYIFGMCVSKGNASLKNIALQVIVDIFSVHGTAVVDGDGKVDSVSLHKIFYKVLKNNELPECQAVAAEGLCKLFLADIFNDDDLFEAFVLAYFSPENSKNEALVQAFAFCIPVYCFSHPNHQERMTRMAADILLRLCMRWDELQNSEPPDEDLSMLKPNIIFQELIFWTDPRKLVNKSEEEASKIDYQLSFLIDVLKVLGRIEQKEIKKMFITNVNSFFISSEQDSTKLTEILEFINDTLENETLGPMNKNSLEKLKNTVGECLQIARDRSTNESSNTSKLSSNDTDEYSRVLEECSTNEVAAAGHEPELEGGEVDSTEVINNEVSDGFDKPNVENEPLAANAGQSNCRGSDLLEQIDNSIEGVAPPQRNIRKRRRNDIDEGTSNDSVTTESQTTSDIKQKSVNFNLGNLSFDDESAADASYAE